MNPQQSPPVVANDGVSDNSNTQPAFERSKPCRRNGHEKRIDINKMSAGWVEVGGNMTLGDLLKKDGMEHSGEDEMDNSDNKDDKPQGDANWHLLVVTGLLVAVARLTNGFVPGLKTKWERIVYAVLTGLFVLAFGVMVAGRTVQTVKAKLSHGDYTKLSATAATIMFILLIGAIFIPWF